ncbi:Crp/Fnr family transcriptional regulator [Chitinophaga sp. Hz27]|uniref:Crp/Fnr family transcriptional regulator n=1 Tax=Chitinophaga sp. Hz27 TaxID=3347169 RepID=UPI0035D8B4A6
MVVLNWDHRREAAMHELLASLNEDAVVLKVFSKNELLLRAGEKTSKVFLVKQGLLRSYFVDTAGKEHTFMFAPEGWIVSDTEAHINAVPAELFIEAMEDTAVYVVDVKKIDVSALPAAQLITEVNKAFKRISVLQRRIIMLLSAPAMERYQHFLETYPDIANRVPGKMIASYLGITPQALSKLRGEKYRNKK